MASKQTEHYGLNQWAGTDQFVRAEFNKDNRAIDLGLQELRSQCVGLSRITEQLGYNVFSLTLQNYYDGKETDNKRGLACDGFLNRDGISILDGGLLWSDGRLVMDQVGEMNRNMGYGSNLGGREVSTVVYTATGGGQLTGCTIQAKNSMSVPSNLNFSYTVTINDKQILTGSDDKGTVPYGGSRAWDISFSQPVSLIRGDRYQLTIATNNSYIAPYLQSDGTHLGGTLYITPITGSVGRLRGVASPAPACGAVLAWVRHQGGLPAVSLIGPDGISYGLTTTGDRPTVTAKGTACSERAFLLNQPLERGSYAVEVTIQRAGDQWMQIFDYGILWV